MNILIVAATEFEIEPFQKKLSGKNDNVSFLITGVGSTFTAFALTKALLQNEYDLVLNVGIGGSFTEKFPIGSVVEIVQDEFADLAYEKQNGSYTTFIESGFIAANDFPFRNGKLHVANPVSNLPKAKAITVNKVHGSENSISLARTKFAANVESMEGAAVFYVCQQLGVRCAQVRSISNFVEPRNRDAWNIPLAIKALCNWLSDNVFVLN